MRRRLIVGNWKMCGDFRTNQKRLEDLSSLWFGVHQAEVSVSPAYPYLAQAAGMLEHTNISLCAQDVSTRENGAFTGEVSAAMLADTGCRYVMVGHSERRHYHNEGYDLIAEKFQAVCKAKMIPILCLGETTADREADRTFDVIGRQLLKVVNACGLEGLAKGVVAYEPIWAIGTGRAATPEQAQDVHSYIREILGPEGEQIRILYGGSVKPDTAEGLFAKKDIDGALVGGASLDARDFVAICRAAE